ncbi:hypothetical protein BH20ACT3_BH20ACT3_10590 [soil metagenome]
MIAAGLIALSAPGCSSDSGSQEAFCEQLPRVPALQTVITGFADADPEQLNRGLDEAAEAYDELRRAAPDDIDDTVDTVADLVDAVLETVSENAADPEQVSAELRAVTARHPGAQAATQEVVTYAAERCEVDLDLPVAPEGTGSG